MVIYFCKYEIFLKILIKNSLDMVGFFYVLFLNYNILIISNSLQKSINLLILSFYNECVISSNVDVLLY